MGRIWKTTYSPSLSTNQHTPTFPDPAVAGHRVIALAGAAATITYPAGWAEHVSAIQDAEVAAASLVAVGGEDDVTVTLGPGGAARAMAGWLESRDDLGGLHGSPVSATGHSVGGVFTIGTVTTTEPDCRIYAAVVQVLPESAWVPGWSSPLTAEDVVYASPPGPVDGGNEDVRLAVASGVAADPGEHVITVSGMPDGRVTHAVAFAFTADSAPPVPPANDIEAENRLAGNPPNEWDINGAGSTTIQGFPTAMSVNRGSTIGFKVHSPSADWTGKVFRLGWYGGNGARQVATIVGGQTNQPAGTTDPETGMVSCANWSTNGSWAVPAEACPGVYMLLLVRQDNPSLVSHCGPFVVRNPARKAPVTVKTSDATWQAYNHAGADPSNVLAGASLYGVGTSGGFTFSQPQRCRAVSYDRPLVVRQFLPQTCLFNAEYPLIRWLERLAYDVDYLSCVDVDADPTLLAGRDVVVSSGHDEYWSAGMHGAFTGARDTGTNLVFLSGNEAFWRINYAAGRRSYACWKDTHDGALNPTGVYSGTWQDTRAFNPDRRPAALLTGQRFRLNGIAGFEVRAAAVHAAAPLWRDTAVEALTGAQTWVSPDHIVGFEADEPADMDPAETPDGMIRLSEASYAISGGLSDDDGDTYTDSGTYVHAFTLYQALSGALVFGGGTVQYAWALDETHDRFVAGLLSTDLQQALTNLLADLGVLPVPALLPAGLVMPTPVDATAYGFPPIEEQPMVFVPAAKHLALDALAAAIDFISAHDAVPDTTGSDEVAGGSYARQGVVWNAAASEQVTQNGAVTIPVPAGTTVVAYGYASALTGGTHYGHALVGNTLRGFGTVDSAGVTANAVQSAGHGLADNARVVVYSVFAESLPAGLAERTVYYVVNSTTDTFKLSLTEGGAAVDITGQGELYWANCVPETFANAGNLEIPTTQLVMSLAGI